MPSPIELIVLGLATWRISSLLVQEEGPWNVFDWLRRFLGVIHDAEGNPVSWPASGVGKALGCLWCTSIWVAPAVLILWWAAPLVIWVFAVSAAAIGLNRWLQK